MGSRDISIRIIRWWLKKFEKFTLALEEKHLKWQIRIFLLKLELASFLGYWDQMEQGRQP